MSEQEYAEIGRRIDEGLALAHEKMLREKALHDESVVVYDPASGNIVDIKAADLLAR